MAGFRCSITHRKDGAHDMPGFRCRIIHRGDGAQHIGGFRCRITHRGEGDYIWDWPLSERLLVGSHKEKTYR